jgi:hypothetical protein
MNVKKKRSKPREHSKNDQWQWMGESMEIGAKKEINVHI